ncbi:MAG: EamA family transporter [Verrucomicrobia bacterium]|nr:EamA family transporter [Verrucomicrobiota bacterium]
MSNDDTDSTIGIELTPDRPFLSALFRGVPPEFMALGSMLSIQLGAALAVPVMSVIGSAPTTALRLLWAAVLLSIIARPHFTAITRRQWYASCGLGITIAILTLCYFLAISRIPMGTATAIEFLGPLGVALVGSRRLGHLILALVAAAGVFLLTRENSHWSVDPTGVFLASIAALGWAIYILLMKKVGASLPGLHGLSIALQVAAVAALPMSFLTANGKQVWLSLPVTWAPFLSTIGLALLSPLLPYALEMAALRRMNTRTFGIFMSIEPAFSAILGYLILNQHLSLRQILGIGCVVTASTIAAAENRAG